MSTSGRMGAAPHVIGRVCVDPNCPLPHPGTQVDPEYPNVTTTTTGYAAAPPAPAGVAAEPREDHTDDLVAIIDSWVKQGIAYEERIAELTALLDEAAAGSLHGWTELQAIDFQRRVKALGTPARAPDTP